MKKLALFIGIAVATNLVVVHALPTLINAVVVHKLVKRSGGYNIAVAWPRADADSRTIVRPSPDLLYTSCAFDVSQHPLHIAGLVQDSYVSVSGFAANTDNFFAVNDSQVAAGADGRKRFDFFVARAGDPEVPAGAKVFTPPSDTGLILFRSLITRDADLPKLKDFQARQACEPLPF